MIRNKYLGEIVRPRQPCTSFGHFTAAAPANHLKQRIWAPAQRLEHRSAPKTKICSCRCCPPLLLPQRRRQAGRRGQRQLTSRAIATAAAACRRHRRKRFPAPRMRSRSHSPPLALPSRRRRRRRFRTAITAQAGVASNHPHHKPLLPPPAAVTATSGSRPSACAPARVAPPPPAAAAAAAASAPPLPRRPVWAAASQPREPSPIPSTMACCRLSVCPFPASHRPPASPTPRAIADTAACCRRRERGQVCLPVSPWCARLSVCLCVAARITSLVTLMCEDLVDGNVCYRD